MFKFNIFIKAYPVLGTGSWWPEPGGPATATATTTATTATAATTTTAITTATATAVAMFAWGFR